MTSDAIKLVSGLKANIESVNEVADFLGFPIEKVESIQDSFKDNTIFSLRRPNNLEGTFAYLAIENELTTKTRANRFKRFFQNASLAMVEAGQTSSEVDFIIVIGKGILIVFDSADYRRRIILTADKLERENSKYLQKLESLKAESLVTNNRYVEDEDFGFIEINQDFKNDLFRFAIADDKQFLLRTNIIRINLLKRIREDKKCQRIIDNIFLDNGIKIDKESNYYGEVVSAVLDTLVLRYILVRILEDRFGYEDTFAKASVSKIGLGTAMTIDEFLEKNVHFDYEEKESLLDKKTKQLNLFKINAQQINKPAVAKVQEEQPNYMAKAYGGDLYVSDIAKAATQIEETLSEEEYALVWNLTSSSDMDFDLADITPGTIGEQYEQTLKMKLEKNNKTGEWYYSKDNIEQKTLGSFYTNSKITDYIIEQTLGRKLTDIKKKLQSAASPNQKTKILLSVLKLKMADITSGGGTFLAGAVRKLGNWYSELEQMSDVKPLLNKIKGLESAISFQKYAVNNMIYGVDLDLKALIVSSFALTLESLGEEQEKLPKLIGKTLINQNSVVSLVPESEKQVLFKAYQKDIKKLYSEKKKLLNNKKNNYFNVRNSLQKVFAQEAARYLKSKKYTYESLEKTFRDKQMAVLEFNLPEVFFDKNGEFSGGFDIIFGNPPYIQLQKKQIFSDEEKYIYQKLGEFKSYKATGDIYTLFYERAVHLLKKDGLLGFITSNKFLRAGYGQSLRNYLLKNTNPLMLVNLGSNMFGATVDTCILILENSKNKDELQAVDLVKRSQEPKKRLENMSDYIEQNKLKSSYQKDESWLILSSIEQSIKNKIESIGTPLKDWNIQINRGILTGCNEAFIIDENKRRELIEKDPKSAEIIRPILRGRDIKKYGYEFKNLYLICTFPSKHYNINDYPAIKDHLLSFDKRKLEQSGQKNIDGIKGNNARKKTNNKWFETQDSISYWDDFNKPKIVFSRISGDTPCFALDNNRCMVNDTAYIITGDNIKYLLDKLCSPEYWFAFRRFYMGGGIEKEFKVNNLKNLPIPFPNSKPLELSEIERKYIYSFQN